jgi:hypothetical protein
MTLDDLIAIAEDAIQHAQDGGYGCLLDDAMDELEPGSELWDMADLMRVHIEQIEGDVGQLAETVQGAESELRSWRKKVAA